MRNLIMILALVLSSIMAREVQAQIQWNPECAVQAAKQFSTCKASGGGTFGCLVQAGFGYWQCSGSSFSGGPVRAAIVGARARRVARRV